MRALDMERAKGCAVALSLHGDKWEARTKTVHHLPGGHALYDFECGCTILYAQGEKRSLDGEERTRAGAALFDLRRYYEATNGCNIDMETGCSAHERCARGRGVAVLWRLAHA